MTAPTPVRAYLGLGGNIGDRQARIAEAIERLDATPGITVVARSRLLETEPWGNTDQAAFVNAAVGIDTTLAPRVLLETILAIETAMGRVRMQKWGPRIIDIDILLYGDETIAKDGLIVPHPFLTQRDFVLRPLAEIAPELEVGGRSIADLAAAFS